MGFPWKKIIGAAKVGLQIGDALGVPGTSAVVSGIHIVESQLGSLKGPQKKEAAMAIARGILAQSGLNEAELASEQVSRAMGAFIDAYVLAQNAIAAADHAKDAMLELIATLKGGHQ